MTHKDLQRRLARKGLGHAHIPQLLVGCHVGRGEYSPASLAYPGLFVPIGRLRSLSLTEAHDRPRVLASEQPARQLEELFLRKGVFN